jgi:hypothetical protein
MAAKEFPSRITRFQNMQRNLTAGLISAVLVLASLPIAAQAPPAQNAPHYPPLPRPSNLQVLPKNIPQPELMSLMRGYTKALGVECEFCHAEDPATHRLNFASDAKPDKATARIMISMTMEINKKYLSTVKDPDATPADKTVTCGTCHRGNSMPAAFGDSAGGTH